MVGCDESVEVSLQVLEGWLIRNFWSESDQGRLLLLDILKDSTGIVNELVLVGEDSVCKIKIVTGQETPLGALGKVKRAADVTGYLCANVRVLGVGEELGRGAKDCELESHSLVTSSGSPERILSVVEWLASLDLSDAFVSVRVV